MKEHTSTRKEKRFVLLTLLTAAACAALVFWFAVPLKGYTGQTAKPEPMIQAARGRFEYSRAGRALHSARHRGEKGAGDSGLPAAERCIPACGRCGLCSGDYLPDRGVLAKPCIC